jgi:chemotaxis protein CheX
MSRAKNESGGADGRRKVGRSKVKTRSKPRTETVKAEDAQAVGDMIAEASAMMPNENFGCVTLPDCLDSAAAPSIKDMLLARRGNAIVVDASQVRRVGIQSLQVLIAAARTWQADEQSYRVRGASADLLETIALIGLPHEDLLLEGSHQ